MEDQVKIKATKQFYDQLSKRMIMQGLVISVSKERAIKIVELGLADIVDRGADKPVIKETVTPVQKPQPVAPVKKPAAKKPAKNKK